MERTTQSLAGRVALFKLFPLEIQELKEADLLIEDPLEQLAHGFHTALNDQKSLHRYFTPTMCRPM